MPELDSSKETQAEKTVQETVDWEKRAKDNQAAYTKSQQELAKMKEELEDQKSYLESLMQYVDLSKISGTQEPEVDGYVSKKELRRLEEQIQMGQQVLETTTRWRMEHPDLVQHEELVSAFIHKTDPRKPYAKRLEAATEQVQKLLEAERAKGAEAAEQKRKKKDSEEAESASLEQRTSVESGKDEVSDDPREYIRLRQKMSLRQQGYL